MAEPTRAQILESNSLLGALATILTGKNPDDSDYALKVGGKMARIAASFNRPADTNAYAANDVVSNSTAATTLLQLAGVARNNGGSGYITGIRLATNLKSITPRFRLHIFNAADATVAADNVTHKELFADGGKRIATIELPVMATAADAANSDSSRTFDYNTRIPFVCAAASRDLFVLFETLDAFAPASAQTFALTIFADLN